MAGTVNGAQRPSAQNGRSPSGDGISVETQLRVLADARDRRSVTFHYVAHAWFSLRDPELPAKQRAAFAELFPDLLRVFADCRGGVISSYFCRNIRVAAVLTDIERAANSGEALPTAPQEGVRNDATTPPEGEQGQAKEPSAEKGAGRFASWRARRQLRRTKDGRRGDSATSSAIHLEPTYGEPDDWKAKELLFRCMDLHYRALEFLTPKPRKICMRMIFGIVTALLGTLDRPPLTGRPRPFSSDLRAVESLELELEHARRYYDRSAQHQAQYEYFVGMACGLVLLVGALVGIGRLTGSGMFDEPLLAAPLAGGAGAVVSVMNRMTRGQLVLNYESGRRTIRLTGVIRPLLGSLFGGALYLLLAGGLVAIAQTPDDETKLLFFYAGIAFLAGFSERFAQDVVSGAPVGPEPTVVGGTWATAPPASRANPTPRVPGTR